MKNYFKEYLYYYHWDPAKALLRAIEADLISPLTLNEPVLDLGCGDGIFSSVLFENKNIIGLDFRHKNLLLARKNKFYSNLITCDARKLSFKDQKFGSVLINSFLEHIKQKDLKSVFTEVNRVLKDTGRVIVTINSSSFGDFDPLCQFLMKIKCNFLSNAWKKHRNRRLALQSLNDRIYWDELFKKSNFKVMTFQHYLPPEAEKAFFFWTSLQYLGISRINLGSIVRLFSKGLDLLGIKFHRVAIARIFSKIIEDSYLTDSKEGSCIFFSLEKIGDINLDSKYDNEYENAMQSFLFCQNPTVSIIIPSLDGNRGGNLFKLIDDLKRQGFNEIEILIVKGISPQGKAINIGASKSKGNILLILDDDSRIDNPNVIGNLVKAINADRKIGMAGAPILVPPEANWLQRRAGSEFPRFGMKIVDKVIESDMACHGCCAIRRGVFEEVGRERENILRGLDPDLRYRMRQKGYKTVLVPDTWVYHPLPGSLGKLIKTFFRNGMGSAYCLKFQPELIYDTDEVLEMKSFQARVPFVARIFRFPIRIFKALIEFKLLRFMSYFVYAVGFYCGILKYSFRKQK